MNDSAIKQERDKREEELLQTFIEVRLRYPDDHFHIVRETLTRIGVPSKKENVLFQSCHILRKKGKYYIVHFKEMFKLDGKPSSLNNEDIARRNTIANKLAEWNLVELIDPAKSLSPILSEKSLKIISSKDKPEWILETKYNIGAIKKKV